MTNKKSVYLGGGFIDSQLLWTLQIICSFCKSKNISVIIFDKEISDKVLKNHQIKKLFSNFNLVFLDRKKKNKFLRSLKILIIYFFQIVRLVFFFKKKNVRNWFKNQINHSYWDTALSLMSDDQIKPNLIQRFKSAILVMDMQKKTFDFLSKYNVCYSFMGHTVYKFRTQLAIFRARKILTFCQANYSFYAQKNFKDFSWNILETKKYLKLLNNLNKNNVNDYWKKRLKGKSNYEDANVASKTVTITNSYPKNVIFLHIFKDSPFNVIDKDRVFFDYFEWILKTVSIIKNSEENWSMRLHPNARRWGENQFIVFKNLIKNLPKNVILDENLISNNNLFKIAKRVVTYSGTSHLEASAFGIKPIIISDVTLSRLNKTYVLKPKNINNYRQLLLKSSNDKIFSQNKKIKKMSKELIFLRENQLTLKKNLNGISIYRGDDLSTFKKEFKIIEKRLKKNYHYLQKIGTGFANGKKNII